MIAGLLGPVDMVQSQTIQVFEAVGRVLDRSSPTSLYGQTRDLIEQRISSHQLRPGDRVPTQRELSKLWGISEVTVRRAMQELAARGLIQSKAGSGTLVVGPAGSGQLPPTACNSALGSVGIVFAGLSDGYPFMRPMIEGIERGCHGKVAIQILDLSSRLISDPGVADTISLADVDALILESPVSLPLVLRCQRQAIPYVLQYSDLADGQSHCVVVNYTTGVLQAVDHLVNQRSRRGIALVTAKHQRFSTGKLLDAFNVAGMVHGFDVKEHWTVYAGYEESDGYNATKRLLSQSPRPDAIMFASDYQARGGLIAAKEVGVNVPESLSIIGMGNLLREREWPIPISTIDLCFDEVGYNSMDLLYAQATHDGGVPLRRSVPSRFMKGQTS